VSAQILQKSFDNIQKFTEIIIRNYPQISKQSNLFSFSPYIANYIYNLPVTAPLNINLQGILLFDPALSTDATQFQMPAVLFVHTHQNIFNLNASFLSYLDEQNRKCGYENYTQTYATYPPSGPLPTLSDTDDCHLWDAIFAAALIINPAFNKYRITDTPPILWDVLGFPGSFPNQQSPIYFARSDVQAAIHAPNINWVECTTGSVFVNGNDQSSPPMYTVLPNVIEKSQRTIIVNGQHDFEVIAEGTRTVIQGMTWYGMQGFQVEPTARFIVPNQGDLGFVHTERGLTYVEVALCGHMVPQFQ
jgi:carboxypeptidase D